MKKNTKKKVLTLALVIALLAIAVVGGSLAWFTADDEATNVFTVGSVDIEQLEQQHDESGNLVDFVQDKVLMPVVGTDPTVGTDNYQEKIVTVKNTGKNPAYVQTFIAVPADLDDNGILRLWDSNAAANGWSKTTFSQGGLTVDGVKYNVYRYRYNTALAAAGEETKPCLEYVYIDSKTDLNTYDLDKDGEIDTGYFVMGDKEIDTIDAFDKLNVLVLTQACQSEGFADAATALETVFPSDVMPDFSNLG